jgi:hypothetical protein
MARLLFFCYFLFRISFLFGVRLKVFHRRRSRVVAMLRCVRVSVHWHIQGPSAFVWPYAGKKRRVERFFFSVSNAAILGRIWIKQVFIYCHRGGCRSTAAFIRTHIETHVPSQQIKGPRPMGCGFEKPSSRVVCVNPVRLACIFYLDER